MKAHPRVIGYLQRALNHEFNAAQLYTLQAVQVESWGMAALAAELRQGVQEELRHAEEFIRRMHAAGATPSAGQARVPQIGRSHAEVLRAGLQTEADAVRLYREAGDFCQRIGDRENFAVFSRILDDEIQHQQNLERQLTALRA